MRLVSDRSYEYYERKKEEVKSILKKIFLTRIDFFLTQASLFFRQIKAQKSLNHRKAKKIQSERLITF